MDNIGQCDKCKIAEFKWRNRSSACPPWSKIDVYTRTIFYGTLEEAIQEFNKQARTLCYNMKRQVGDSSVIEVRWSFYGNKKGYVVSNLD